jgi:hypothetical protein
MFWFLFTLYLVVLLGSLFVFFRDNREEGRFKNPVYWISLFSHLVWPVALLIFTVSKVTNSINFIFGGKE